MRVYNSDLTSYFLPRGQYDKFVADGKINPDEQAQLAQQVDAANARVQNPLAPQADRPPPASSIDTGNDQPSYGGFNTRVTSVDTEPADNQDEQLEETIAMTRQYLNAN